MNWRPSNALLWFGVGGGACAFVLEFVAGLAFSFAQCNQPPGGGSHLPVRTWQVALAAGGAVVALASTAVSAVIFLRTFRIGEVFTEERRGGGYQPPLGRIHFLAIIALTVNFLILAVIILDAVGTGWHSFCQQS